MPERYADTNDRFVTLSGEAADSRSLAELERPRDQRPTVFIDIPDEFLREADRQREADQQD